MNNQNPNNDNRTTLSTIRTAFPSAIAIYDLGSHYGIANSDELFFLANKETLEPDDTLMRYQSEAIDLINKAIPIWYADE